jgi:branched-chain amino acid transport system ATP-binding protein
MAILEVRNLSKSYGGLRANAGVSFGVEPRTIVGLIGPNGAGKTTLFNCVTGHEPLDKGEVVFDGVRINGQRPDQICRLGMARTWQKVKPLANLSVMDNVVVGSLLRTRSLRTAREIAEKVLETVGMAHRARVISGSLPIGERKKLEIARLLGTKPKLLLLDEVMGGLNPKEREDVIQLLFDLREQGVTFVVIEHDMKSIMRICDQIVVLCSGELLANGTPRDVVENRNVIRAYLGDTIDA